MILEKAIETSDLTQREIADRVGFRHGNIISMLKSGDTRIQLNWIPALAQVLGMDERELLKLAIQEYHPGVHKVLVEALGRPLLDAELGILTMFGMATIRGEIEIEGPLGKLWKGFWN